MDPAWVRDLRDRSLAAGVAFFFKQWGRLPNKPSAPWLETNESRRHRTRGGSDERVK
jgi:protein gp37